MGINQLRLLFEFDTCLQMHLASEYIIPRLFLKVLVFYQKFWYFISIQRNWMLHADHPNLFLVNFIMMRSLQTVNMRYRYTLVIDIL